MLKSIESLFRKNRVFIFLITYRWISLIPAVVAAFINSDASTFFLLVLGAALFVNVFVSVFNRRLNRAMLDRPILLGLDILFAVVVLAITGGVESPYYLYALSPLLAGAFFFQVRGALIASATFTPLYLAAFSLSGLPKTDGTVTALLTQLAGVWLLPILFAYPSTLLKSIRKATSDLSAAHRQLEIIHDLTMVLQAAPDLVSVQKRVLEAVTTDLGFSKAVVALVDPAHEELGGWMVYPPGEPFPDPRPLPLNAENGLLGKTLLDRVPLVTDGQKLVQDAEINEWFTKEAWYVMPLFLREHPVGVLLVNNPELAGKKEAALMTVANQAALALGTTILCIDRARRLAVETERNRIARDIHDTVAQSLFGITYSLEACIGMLPDQAAEVKNELIELRALARDAHDGVRRSIFDLWPSSLTIEMFMTDLRNYVGSCCRSHAFSIIFNHHGNFNSLAPGLRRTIYRMAQEALANSAKHSGADSARLCMTIDDHEVVLDISDRGQGFDPSIALSRSQNREHFGLHGLQERARTLGGDCEIISMPSEGTRVIINLPVNGHHHA